MKKFHIKNRVRFRLSVQLHPATPTPGASGAPALHPATPTPGASGAPALHPATPTPGASGAPALPGIIRDLCFGNCCRCVFCCGIFRLLFCLGVLVHPHPRSISWMRGTRRRGRASLGTLIRPQSGLTLGSSPLCQKRAQWGPRIKPWASTVLNCQRSIGTRGSAFFAPLTFASTPTPRRTKRRAVWGHRCTGEGALSGGPDLRIALR